MNPFYQLGNNKYIVFVEFGEDSVILHKVLDRRLRLPLDLREVERKQIVADILDGKYHETY